MITETGKPIDFKRSVLDVRFVKFKCGRVLIPVMIDNLPRIVDQNCRMDDCWVCNKERRDEYEAMLRHIQMMAIMSQ